MPRFSSAFSLSLDQSELDFVDIDLSTDNRFYLDPYAIEIRNDDWSGRCGDHVRSYFQELLDALRNDNQPRIDHLLGHLHEPNETYLGQSSGRPRGRGVGSGKAKDLSDAIAASRAFETGMLSDISEAELFVRGVGPDTISDLTTNILRGLLGEYTDEQCKLHGIDTRPLGIGPNWNPSAADWEARPLNVPVFKSRPVLLVPKFSVRHRLSIDSQEFWNHHMIEFLQNEYMEAGSSLVKTFKTHRRSYVTKKSVKERHPYNKDDIASFVRDHPEVLEIYKKIAGAKGPLTEREFDDTFDERAFAEALSIRLKQIPQGTRDATAYHRLAIGICTFLFYPHLIYPIKELEIHDGRKRIDIVYTNSSERGFFNTMLQSPQARALKVPVECKNYSQELDNPALDQLIGRFSHRRGFFGMILCRSLSDRERFILRCRDAALEKIGYIIMLEDRDLLHLLTEVKGGRRSGIDRYLHERFNEICT